MLRVRILVGVLTSRREGGCGVFLQSLELIEFEAESGMPRELDRSTFLNADVGDSYLDDGI